MKLWKIIVGIVASLLAGGIGSFFTSPSIPTWYASLARPDLAPPNWIFAPLWTTLFVLMGIAVGLVWSMGTEKRGVKMALGLFGLQLVLNSLWSIIFFGLQSPGWAFIEILVLWTAIAIAIASFYKIYRPAAWLLLPYIAWVSFAAYLNYSIWMLN